MLARKIIISIFVLSYVSLLQGLTLGSVIQASGAEKEEYKQDLAKIKTMRKSLSPELGKSDREAFKKDPDKFIKQLEASRDKNDLGAYEKFADGILNKWKSKNPECYGRLTIYLCADLSGGTFKDERCYELRRQYALSALEKSNEMTPVTELDLTGYVTTSTVGPNAPKGEDFTQHRKKDAEIRFLAWQHLLNAIDSTWDPNDLPQLNVVPPKQTGLPSGVSPQAIENPVLRAEYEATIEANRQKTEKYNEQYRLRGWLKRYPKQVEEYIVWIYSVAPYNNEELTQSLNDYKVDEETKARIIDTVTKSIEKQKKLQK